MENNITIFTDGSSKGNPGPGGFAFIVRYPNAQGIMHIDEGGGGEELTTNNRMEMRAVVEAFTFFDGYYDTSAQASIGFTVYLDSSYVLNGISKWVFGWAKNGWKTSLKEPVLNADIWKEMMEVTQGKKIEWKLLKGHSGIKGNERCDEIATSFAGSFSGGSQPSLFKGEALKYPFDLLDISKATTSSSGSSSSKAKAYSYVSLVDGHVMTHKTWVECEKRVKGAKGARFKKVVSASEEDELIKSWQ